MIKILYVNGLNEGVYLWRIENFANKMVKLKERCAVNVIFPVAIDENVAWDKICIGYGEQSKRIQNALQSACRFYDVIIFQKIQHKEGIALIRELKKEYPNVKFVLECDDNFGEVPPSHTQASQFTDQHMWAVEHFINSDAVICSTEYLKQSILKIQEVYNEKAQARYDIPIHVAPNCVDGTFFKGKGKQEPNEVLTFGYVAGSGHDEDLLIAYRAFLPYLDRVKLKIRYGGMRPDYLAEHTNIDFKRVNWHISKYPQKIWETNIDVGIAPLRDTEFNRCKSNLRWLEMSAFGVPIIASDIEPFSKTDGFMYRTSNEIKDWQKTIEQVIEDYSKPEWAKTKELVKKQCRNNYNLLKETNKVIDFLNGVCQK